VQHFIPFSAPAVLGLAFLLALILALLLAILLTRRRGRFRLVAVRWDM